MTLQTFDTGGNREQPCRECNHDTMTRQHNANNNGWQVVCPQCGSRRPWGQLTYLVHSPVKCRKDDSGRDGCSVVEVWQKFKNRCAVCTLPMYAIVELQSGCSRHHVTERYDSDEVDCPIIPVCNRCKPIVDARQRESWAFYRLLQECKSELISGSSTELPASRVSPDSVRPSGKASFGLLEGLSNDDAKH